MPRIGWVGERPKITPTLIVFERIDGFRDAICLHSRGHSEKTTHTTRIHDFDLWVKALLLIMDKYCPGTWKFSTNEKASVWLGALAWLNERSAIQYELPKPRHSGDYWVVDNAS